MNQGLLVFIYADSMGDCTNGGISSKHDKLVLVAPGPEPLGPFPATAGDDAVYLARFMGRLIAVPEVDPSTPVDRIHNGRGWAAGGHWLNVYRLTSVFPWQFGGNFCYSSDSRFPADAPIHVYDRRE